MTLAPDLPPLRDVIREHGLTARKALGQNFLLDINLTRRIARAAGPLDGIDVVEVGPGPGGLTRALLLEGAREVVAIEKDPRCLAALQELGAAFPGRLRLVSGDALRLDISELSSGPVRIVANLPYNIATALLIGWLTGPKWPPWWESMTLMFQREVAERIVAGPGTKAYGRLSIISRWRAAPRILFDVDRRAFTPPPKVTSSVVQFIPLTEPAGIAVKTIERTTAAAFGQRRKMLRSSLRSLTPDPEVLLADAGIDPTCRAEELTIDAFLELCRAFNRLERPDPDRAAQ
jgi:16S rRNA (adenine1518-N6/adenine1519-N6)-dimethyltransferase